MKKSTLLLGFPAVCALGAASALTPPPPAPAGGSVDAELVLEKNVTDNDAEIVLAIDSDVAIDRLHLFGANGRPVLSVRSNDGEDLGLAEILVESAEPSVQAVLDAWLEGAYLARVRAVAGGWIVVPAGLDHDLLAEPLITYPLDGDTVRRNGAVVTWQADPGAEAYLLEIEHDDLELGLSAELPAAVTSFAVPDDFLVPGEEFELAVEGENGNVTVTESSFFVQ